jgi:hypothetical protein
MATRIKISDVAKRWFSTGFMAGGVGSVDAGSHTLKDAVLIRPGEALGHGLWIDDEFCASLVAMCASIGDGGIKARFGHPGMCSEALGTFLGRWKSPRLSEDGRVVGDLHLSSTAAKSPKGDLRAYVEEMAAKEPQHFGASIVFTRNEHAEVEYAIANGATVDGEYLDFSGFKSPDARNVQNLPHARCAELHAADLVDDPAATDGMFSGASGLSLAAQMTEWLDTHPGVLAALNDKPELSEIVTRYADQLKPFLARYQANAALSTVVQTATTVWTDDGEDKQAATESPDAAEPATGTQDAPAGEDTAEPESGMQAQTDALTAQLSAAQAEIAQLQKDVASATSRAEAAEAAFVDANVARTQLTAQLTTAGNERDEARHKLAVIESSGPAPLSAKAAEFGNSEKISPWKRAQR